MRLPVAYLAGPMVFLPQAGTLFDHLKAECRACGLAGLSPLDPPGWAPELEGEALAAAIREANIAKIRQSDVVLACISPFRGPGADAGTAWEMGFAEALGIPVVAWTEALEPYVDRAQTGGDDQGRPVDRNGLLVEDFGLADNLMLAVGVPVLTSFPEAAREAARLLGLR